MNPNLESEFNRIEASRKKLVERLKKYDDDLLNKKPKPEAWSVIEVMNHLMTSEEASLRYLQKKTLDTSRAKKSGINGVWKLLALKVAFSIPVNYKAPKVVEPSSEFATLADTDAKWTKIRTDIFDLLKGLKDSDYGRELWKHALGGKMNIYLMVNFFGFHFDRHQKQIERTIAMVQ